MYYPKSLINVYQAAQNIAAAHFPSAESCCPYMPSAVLQEIEIQKPRRDASKAGRSYWLEACQGMGIYEHEGALWLKRQQSSSSSAEDAAARQGGAASPASSSSSHIKAAELLASAADGMAATTTTTTTAAAAAAPPQLGDDDVGGGGSSSTAGV